MSDVDLVMNAGSSSLKFAAYGAGSDVPVMKGKVAGIGRAPEFSATGSQPDALGVLTPETGHDEVVQKVLGWLTAHPDFGDVRAVGHRVVHGGRDFAQPVLVTDAVLDALTELEPLAPSHQPHNLAAIRAVRSWKPDLPQVACFDTGFHASQTPLNRMFGPALEGLVMGRRCGSLDPGVLIYMQQSLGMSVGEIETLLYKQSGLHGVSGGVSNAMQVLQDSSDPLAQEAIELFCLRAAQELSRMLPSIGGLDALVFTGACFVIQCADSLLCNFEASSKCFYLKPHVAPRWGAYE